MSGHPAASSRVAIALLVASLLLVAWATLTPGGVPGVTAPRACFFCGTARVTDAIANVLLFIPLGAALVLRGASVARATTFGLIISCVIEALQFAGMPAGRVTSLADLLCNATGTCIGATMAHQRAVLFAPSPRTARMLALVWSGFVAAVLLATAWLIGDPRPVRDTSAPPPHLSALPFTPGFGWFEGVVGRAVIDGAMFAQAFNGPLIIETAARRTYSASLAVTGRDRRTTIVPVLFMHRPADTLPVLLVAQWGDRYVLRADSRAVRLGFAAPDLIVQRAPRPASAPGASSLVLNARVSARSLSLTVDQGDVHRSVELLRTATPGWAFLQSLVPLGHRYGRILTCVWLALLLAPLGYWGWLARALQGSVVMNGGLLLCLSLFVSLRAFGVASPPPVEFVAMLGGVFVGLAAGRLSAAVERTRGYGRLRPLTAAERPL